MSTKNLLIIGAILVVLASIVACVVLFIVAANVPLEEPVALLPMLGSTAFFAIPIVRPRGDDKVASTQLFGVGKLDPNKLWQDTKITFEVFTKGRRSVTICTLQIPGVNEALRGIAFQNPCDDFSYLAGEKESFRHALEGGVPNRFLRGILWEMFLNRCEKEQLARETEYKNGDSYFLTEVK